jgi:hypothetical protein
MTTRTYGIRVIALGALLAVAILIGIAVAAVVALLGHQILVFTVGEEGIPAIDDTLLMRALVAGTYLAGFVSGTAVVALGWKRLIRRRL